ncbi:carboxyvinyl-carboxyphosphonate phosphorylmutase [Actinomadura sp. NBRC 104412]|uniref:isocitrate lyase/PEP mutase family protein n=1 Tax=Actinomadura sp. NBRC 104412 TaxID=3032203 RepID=UPI0024A34725|nr:isocitrate lyase/phosphoenolpyruvate mutase family protein [Actinomadura sp. NBRC 104412]GLZ09051.1 carboxyvinyl-carboxyphosphonate phosphorylmutase [Actinomadura sp. NBRC 104412]
MTDHNEKAALLRELHRPGDPLILPNVWDAGSAAIVEQAGFPALATASAAIAAMLGYPDHEGAPVDEMFAAASRVIRAATVPVTVDAEAGYGLPAAELVERLAGIGAVGCNLEDTDHETGELVPAARQADYIAAVRAAATAAGTDLVINARADTFITRSPEPVRGAIERGRLYLEAGADCVYPIMASAEDDIAALTKGIPGPVNANAISVTPGRLAELGVARISYGPMPYLHALDALKSFVTGLREGDSSEGS